MMTNDVCLSFFYAHVVIKLRTSYIWARLQSDIGSACSGFRSTRALVVQGKYVTFLTGVHSDLCAVHVRVLRKT